MTISLQTPVPAPAPTPPIDAAPTAGRRVVWRYFWIILAVLTLFVGTYAYAWSNAYQLSNRFVDDANASFAAGDYLDALVSSQEFDQAANRYVTRGGYISVERMWSAPYSWPKPAAVQVTQERVQEIIAQHLTVEDAEQYIQANTGRPSAPYFGEIYLRLGELYEAEAYLRDAEDIYTSIPTLFPNRPDLIERANEHLAQLPAAQE